MDATAAVVDETRLLQSAGHERDAAALHTQHLREDSELMATYRF